MSPLHRKCQFAGRPQHHRARHPVGRSSVAVLAALFAAVVGLHSADAGDVTREVNDGSKAIRSISLTPAKTVILRHLVPGQPLRYSYFLNFPLAEASKVTGILEKFLQVSDGTNDGDNLPTEFGSIGKTTIALIQTGERNEASYVLRVSEPPRSISAEDARQFLTCIKLLPEMEREHAKIASVGVK